MDKDITLECLLCHGDGYKCDYDDNGDKIKISCELCYGDGLVKQSEFNEYTLKQISELEYTIARILRVLNV